MRVSRAVGAAVLALATCAGASAIVTADAAATPTAQAPGGEATVSAPPGAWPPELALHAAGTGVLLRNTYVKEPTYWQSTADGRQVTPDCGIGVVRLGDEVACQGPTELKIRNLASGTLESVPLQQGQVLPQALSPTQVLAITPVDADGHHTFRLLGRAGEPRKDVTVALPEAVNNVSIVGSDARGALVDYWDDQRMHRLGLIDYATATMKRLPHTSTVSDNPASFSPIGLGTKWIAVADGYQATLVSREDLTVTRSLPLDVDPTELLPVGDWLLAHDRSAGEPVVKAYPVGGGASRPVLDRLDRKLLLGTDGSAYALSTAGGSTRWAVNQVAVDDHGALRVREAAAVAARPSDRRTLTFAQGALSSLHVDFSSYVLGYRTSVKGPVTVSGTPEWRCDHTWQDPYCPYQSGRTGVHIATGDGRIVGLGSGESSSALTAYVREARPGGANRTVRLANDMQDYSILGASGRYLLVRGKENGTERLLVADIDAGRTLDVKPAAPASLWGAELWQPEGDKGVVAATDLRTGKITRRVDLGTGCRPYELQVNGDWFYSTCSAEGTGATAYHASSGKRIPLPFLGSLPTVRLGDGYLVQQTVDGLRLYNLRSGTAVKEHETAESPSPVGFGRGWAVDAFGGRLAYLDREDTLHVVGVTGATSPLAVIDQNLPATLDTRGAGGRQARWWLSKPAASWNLVLRNKATGLSTAVRSGGEARGVIDLTWDGKDKAGRAVPNGTYEWTLTVVPADGQGSRVKATGPVTVAGPGLPGGLRRP
ncbi:FlgD immunoglobulin-like domain containing protein [Streptomyces sp. NPDC047718]|uniref:FlgD immunoglobulin-like domain containing protein n=1 Tax=Streptomyces sp. NPDC047718 TaxID=3155479 RepID=UPI0033D19092